MTTPRRLPGDFSRSAAYPLFAFDPAQDRAWVLHFRPEDYRRASFLDQRALHHRDIPGWVVSRAELAAGLDLPPAPDRLHWLFHIGHCGSTLASRLMDLLPGVLGVREPLPLLTLAGSRGDIATQSWRDIVLHLLTRGFDDTRAVIVKPTSLVTTLAGELLHGSGKGCLLWVDLQTWLATMLREKDLTDAVFDNEDWRLAGSGLDRDPLSDGPRLSRVWLAEQMRWQQLMTDPALAPRLMDLDFASLLADPAAVSARLAAHYGLEVPADWARRIEDSGLLTRYAKDDAQQFDAQTRERELAAAADRHASAIAEGLRWAEAAIDRLDLPVLAGRLRRGSRPTSD
ncbi:hypothetical protein J2X06_002437 [Lysobacter niastensis]|uniref:Sulfotransferase family protein n=1 Tax=Lysobacter niastensis TaxID=380629 RepID=A0ABU1WCB4_9GAMM|nr:hypothetical protein [Lysobacter niastensis]MDR7135228.1 hypothetical protein [Lysobacter niastensis]